jgi:carbamate kinase
MRTVIALGGNAIASGDEVTTSQQRSRVTEISDSVETLVDHGHELVFTHGNGPQVGQLLLEQAGADVPERPLDVLVADTQGRTGYLIADGLESVVDGRVVSMVTRTRVAQDDPAFQDPSKPVGPYYTETEAAQRPFETGPVRRPDGKRAYRRMVPSPEPVEVLESDEIRALLECGATVVCGGGGGVPVVGNSGYEGVEAVVDKDYTSQLVASAVEAECLVMATDVEYAYRDFGTDDERPIRETDAASLRGALADGEFADGSMRPKVESCLRFLEGGGEQAVITTPDAIAAAVVDNGGTQIHP